MLVNLEMLPMGGSSWAHGSEEKKFKTWRYRSKPYSLDEVAFPFRGNDELAWMVATEVKTLHFFQISLYLRAYVRVIHQIKGKFPVRPSLEKQNIQGNIDITKGQGIGKYV